jgi:hypothetical protein
VGHVLNAGRADASGESADPSGDGEGDTDGPRDGEGPGDDDGDGDTLGDGVAPGPTIWLLPPAQIATAIATTRTTAAVAVARAKVIRGAVEVVQRHGHCTPNAGRRVATPAATARDMCWRLITGAPATA